MIKVLDSNIADKIAAGEVIERPVSIVKELVENSIDAGSTSIVVEIKNGGKSYIRVTDNGCGISSNEISTAFLRHATSKISDIIDLENITSLGFRGEALSSIVAVSRLTIVSKTENEAFGTKLVIHGGKEISNQSVGANVGTTIFVEDLFYNTPARRKFLGTDAREASAIIELIEHYAICYSSIRFMLVNNGINLFTTEGDGNTLNTIKTIFPTKEYRDLIEINSKGIKGYISNPGITKSTRRSQLFFVNGRLVNSSLIEKSIDRGYGDRVFSGYPIAILFIEINPNSIDVNIHPSKKEIKFLNQELISQEIQNAIMEGMSYKESIPEIVNKNEKYNTYVPDISRKEVNETIDITDYLNSINDDNLKEISFVQEQIQPKMNISIPKPFDLKSLRYSGYLFNSYIVLETKDEFYILDQHAAHERVFYENLTDNYLKTSQIPQPVLTPIVLNVSADIYNTDRQWLEVLAKIGYDIEDFGPNTFIIKGIPSYMSTSEANLFVDSFIENSDDLSSFNTTVIDKLIMKSCKSAVKANNKLSEIEILKLVEQLGNCRNPFSCPHGRPTFIKYTRYELERSFKRK